MASPIGQSGRILFILWHDSDAICREAARTVAVGTVVGTSQHLCDILIKCRSFFRGRNEMCKYGCSSVLLLVLLLGLVLHCEYSFAANVIAVRTIPPPLTEASEGNRTLEGNIIKMKPRPKVTCPKGQRADHKGNCRKVY